MKDRRGFTLLEMIIVITIMMIILSFAVPSLSAYRRNAGNSEAENQQKVLNKAIGQYYALQGRYPVFTAANYTTGTNDKSNPPKAGNKLNSSGISQFNGTIGNTTGIRISGDILNYEHDYFYEELSAATHEFVIYVDYLP